jgi:hypothetical protein
VLERVQPQVGKVGRFFMAEDAEHAAHGENPREPWGDALRNQPLRWPL